MDQTSNRTLKKEVLELYRGNWITAIKINIIPIVCSIFSGFIIASLIGIILYFFSQIDSSALGTMGNYSQNSGTHYSGRTTAQQFFFQAIVVFFTVGIQYGILDWLRHRNQRLSWGTAFQTFSRKYFTSTLAIFIFQFIFRFLWSFLLIIPGWIKYYSYSQAYFLYKEATDRKISDRFEFVNFITFSRRLMDGNKARLLGLQISLIGWYILSIITFGIGFIWYVPYRNGLYAAFYKNLVEQRGQQVLPEIFG